VLKFPADTAIRGRSSAPVLQRNILCRGDGRTSSAVKGSLRQRLTALCLARLRRPRPRFARHFAAPHPPSCRIAIRRGTSSKLADARSSGE